jgi:hypothetical protein
MSRFAVTLAAGCAAALGPAGLMVILDVALNANAGVK